jgi:hypothetical protein
VDLFYAPMNMLEEDYLGNIKYTQFSLATIIQQRCQRLLRRD